jgi:cytochrome b subunit of formate dehydrogenase
MIDKNTESFPRFRLIARIEHIILLVSFTMLAITGLPQMYPTAAISQTIVKLLGGIEPARFIHRLSAFALVAGSVYHLTMGAYRSLVRRERMRILPRMKDAQDLRDTVLYNLGFSNEPPRMAKFNFGEKLEYWAVIWGTAVMIITGFMLWNPIATTAVLPGEFIPAALAAHGGEALLAVLSIVIWHLYNVLIKHRNFSMFTGNLPRHQMEEEHMVELERLEAGGGLWLRDDKSVDERRLRIFIVVSVLVGLITIGGLVWLFTFEQTALTTIPRVTKDIFVPLVTPIP